MTHGFSPSDLGFGRTEGSPIVNTLAGISLGLAGSFQGYWD